MADNKIQKIGVFTSGGDSPGMNAAIRAVTLSALQHNIKTYGIYNGYEGMIDNRMIELSAPMVNEIIGKGGTILRSARSKRFRTEEGMQRAYENLKLEGIDAIVAIGGDGTSRGALEFGNKYNIPFMGLPGTIDNDLFGTDLTIGFDTALNTVVDAVDKIRDTATSHDRLFFVEVMGRDAGFIALHTGIATGAAGIMIPEAHTSDEKMVDGIAANVKKHGRSAIIIVAEGDEAGGAFKIADQVKAKYDYFDIRVSILGHMQRGGSPSCRDRVLATTLGYESVHALLKGRRHEMVGIVNKKIVYTPFEKATKHNIEVDKVMMQMANELSAIY